MAELHTNHRQTDDHGEPDVSAGWREEYVAQAVTQPDARAYDARNTSKTSVTAIVETATEDDRGDGA